MNTPQLVTHSVGLKLHPAPVAFGRDRSEAAHEMKFLLPNPVADRVLNWARLNLAPDPHVDRSMGDAYRVNTLYFDTAGFDVYHRFGSFGWRKHRIRRYGHESRVFLERKSKSSGLVRKRRTLVSESDLAMLPVAAERHGCTSESQAAVDAAWPGHWFSRRLVARRLAPQCHVTYDRVARVEMTPEGPIRLTVDRQIRCRAAAGISVPQVVDGATLLADHSSVELKFRVALPALFKNLVHEFSLTPSSVSKYRLSVEACGLNAVKRLGVC